MDISFSLGRTMLDNWTSPLISSQTIVGIAAASETRVDGQDNLGNAIENMKGGLGIQRNEEWMTMSHPQIEIPGFALLNVALGHTAGSGEQFIDFERKVQKLLNTEWSLEQNDNFLPLGVVTTISTGNDEELKVSAFLHKPLLENRFQSPLILGTVDVPGITDGFYPPNSSLEALLSQLVLAKLANELAKEYKIFTGKSDQVGTAIVHDCHGGFLPFYMWLDALKKRNILKLLAGHGPSLVAEANPEEWEDALNFVRQHTITTIHAPQKDDTVNRFSPTILEEIFGPNLTTALYRFGKDHINHHLVNTLNLPIELSYAFTAVSPSHGEITMDPTNQLIPYYFIERVVNKKKKFYVTSNAVLPFTWLSPHRQKVYAGAVPGCLTDPSVWMDPENPAEYDHVLMGQLLVNLKFRKAFVASREEDRKALIALLNERKIEVPEDAVIFGAMRRATAYKLSQLNRILENELTNLKIIANCYGPIILLFGGVVPENDSESAVLFKRLLRNIEKINQEGGGKLRAAFFSNYNKDVAKTILAGVDVWGMFSDSTTDSVTLYEAFGPSGAKSQINGALGIAGSGSWTSHYNDLGQAVFLFGPNIHVHGRDVGMGLREVLSHQEKKIAIRGVSDTDFSHVFGNVCGLVRRERNLIKQGRGHLAESIYFRLHAVRNGLHHFHPKRLLIQYRDIAREIRKMGPEICVDNNHP